MADAAAVADLLARNPAVDPDRLRKILEATKRRRGQGGVRYRYNIVPPFSGRNRERGTPELSDAKDCGEGD